MKSVLVALAVAALSVANGLVSAYKVEPVKAEWSGRTGFQDTIGQTVVCCWDELDSISGGYVELFCGYHQGNGRYNLDIKDCETNQLVAKQQLLEPGKDHDWLESHPIKAELDQFSSEAQTSLPAA